MTRQLGGRAELAVVVQSDAVGELPAGVESIERPVAAGTRRAIEALRSVGPADVVHGLDVDLPLRRRSPRVTTVHDLAVFDTPDAFSRYRAMGERLLLTRAIRTADEVIAVSNFTAERIEHHFGRSATVTPLAPSVADRSSGPAGGAVEEPGDGAGGAPDVRDELGLPERFVLQVATIEPRKDGQLLAAACRRLGLPLVLAGGLDPRCRVPDGAIHLGRVSDADRDRLVDAATVIAYISRYEGFGLPPVEAMARGRPVVATAVGGLPDVVDDGAVLIAADVDELERALRQLWLDDDARRHLGDAGRRAAGRLSWGDTAARTIEAYRRIGLAS